MPAMLSMDCKEWLFFRKFVFGSFGFNLNLGESFSRAQMICSRSDWFSKVITKSSAKVRSPSLPILALRIGLLVKAILSSS